MVRHGLPIVVAGMLLCFVGCASKPALVAEQAPSNADQRRLVREYNALLRSVAIDVRSVAQSDPGKSVRPTEPANRTSPEKRQPSA